MGNKISTYTAMTTLASGDLTDFSKDMGAGVYVTRSITWANVLLELAADLTISYTNISAMSSAQFAGLINDETGSGLVVFNNTPILITPVLGVATATSINGNAFNGAVGSTWNLANGKTFSSLKSITLDSLGDGITATFKASSGTVAYLTDITNLGNSDLTSSDNARTFTLKTGTTATQNYQFKNSAGTIGYYFDGADSLGFKTSTFASVGSGINQNFVIGSTTKPVVEAHYLDTLTAGQYKAYELFADTKLLYSIDTRGAFTYYNIDYNNTKPDLRLNTTSNTARLEINGWNTGVFTKALSMNWNGVEAACIAVTNFAFSGEVYVNNDSGTKKTALYGNRAQGYLSYFGEGAQFGGSNGTFNASALIDIQSTTQGLGLPSMTSTQRSAISSPREGLMVYQNDGTEAVYAYVNSAWTALGNTGMVTNVGTGSWSPNAAWNGNTNYTTTITVTGALTTDKVILTPNKQYYDDMVTAVSRTESLHAYVESADTVRIWGSVTSYTTLSASASLAVMVVR